MKVYILFEGYNEGNYVDGFIAGVSKKRIDKNDLEFELDVEDNTK